MDVRGRTATGLRESETDVGDQSSSRLIRSEPRDDPLRRCIILWTRRGATSETGHGTAPAGGLHIQVHDSNREKVCSDRKRSLSLHLGMRTSVGLPYWTPVPHTDGPQATSLTV